MQPIIIDPHYIVHFIKKTLYNTNITYDEYMLSPLHNYIPTTIVSTKSVQLLYFCNILPSNFKTNIYEYNIKVLNKDKSNISFSTISNVMINDLDISINDIYSMICNEDDDDIVLDCSKNIIYLDNINTNECSISIYKPTLLILSNSNIDKIIVKYTISPNNITDTEINIIYFELMIFTFLLFYLFKLSVKEKSVSHIYELDCSL